MAANSELLARAYYTAMSKKNISELEEYLHSDVQMISPFVKIAGKEAVLGAIKKFTSYFETLTIRAHFGSDNQAVVIYDVAIAAPIGNVNSVAYMNFKDNRIFKIELFFDARPFDKK